jgi:hypothetical protein
MTCKAPARKQIGLTGKGVAPVCRVTETTLPNRFAYRD